MAGGGQVFNPYKPKPATPAPKPKSDMWNRVNEAVRKHENAIQQSIMKADPAYQDPYSYENIQFGYTPQLLSAPDRLNASSLGMQRYQANLAADAAGQSGLLTGLSSIASTSGLSAADRQALQDQAQRVRVTGMQRAQSPFNQMAAENLYQADQFNTENRQKVAAQNQAILNQYEEDKAAFERQKQELIYKQRNEEARLQQALEAAAKTAY